MQKHLATQHAIHLQNCRVLIYYYLVTQVRQAATELKGHHLLLMLKVTFQADRIEIRLKDKPLCNSHRKPALHLLKRGDRTHHDDDVCVFSRCFPGVPSVNLNLLTVYNHIDAVWCVVIRAVTIHQTHDSVCITIFDPQFDTNHNFFKYFFLIKHFIYVTFQ